MGSKNSACQYQSAVIMTHLTAELLPTGKARVAPWCEHHKRPGTRPAGKRTRPSVGKNGPLGAFRRLPDAWHRAAHRAYPRGCICAINWVIIIALWYKRLIRRKGRRYHSGKPSFLRFAIMRSSIASENTIAWRILAPVKSG